MDHITSLVTVLLTPLTVLGDPGQPWSVYFLAACMVFTLGFVVVARARRGGRLPRLAPFMRFLFDHRVWLHRSSLLDYKLFAVNTVLLAGVLGLFAVSAAFWQQPTLALLSHLFGPPPMNGAPGWGVFALTTLVQVMALDLGYWLAHYAFHHFPLLWEFHKVHHSAEVMTPATELRQHPVELIAFPLVYGFTTGLTYALMVQIFGAEAQALGLQGQTAILALHLATFHHLRHSHVNMPFTGWWGRLFHSPAHHKIHHSDNPKHFDRNLGYLFSLWDWMAGTLYMPVKGERVSLGIGHEGKTHDSVRAVMWLPLRNAALRLGQRVRLKAGAGGG